MFLKTDVGWRLFPEFFTDKARAAASSQAEEIRTKCRLARTRCVRLCDLSNPSSLRNGFAIAAEGASAASLEG
jgi:hypothetical protein